MNKESAIDRIKKLLRLSKSDNEHEAELAAANAARLMVEFQIEEAELGDEKEEIRVNEFTLEVAKRITVWRARVAYAAAIMFGGQIYSNNSRGQTRLMFVGREQDLDAVKYLFAYFASEVESLADSGWHRYRRTMGSRSMLMNESARGWKGSYRKGCAARIYDRIYREREAAKGESTSTALVKLDALEQQAKDYLDNLPGVTERREYRTAMNHAYEAGWQDGASVNTSTGHTGLGPGQKRLGKE